MGSGAFRVLFFFSFFCSIQDRYMGCAFRIQSVTDRVPDVVNGYKLFIKNRKIRPAVPDLHNEAQQSLFAHLLHVSQGNQMYILKLFFCLSHVASTTEGSLRDQTFPHSECSRPSFTTPSSRPTSSEKFCQFHQVSRSSPICSVSVLCHSVHIHSSNAHALAQHCMQAYSTHRWQLESVRSTVRRHTVCTKHDRSKLPFSVSLRTSTVTIYYYIYII